MFTSRDLKDIIIEARPIVERQLDDALIIASFRETVTAKGGDWSQVKALVKAMIQDERDDAGGHKRVLAILHKAGNALGYADMLGLGNLNEKNSFPDHDPITGEIADDIPSSNTRGQPGGDDPGRQDDAASSGEDGNTVSETNNGGRHETARDPRSVKLGAGDNLDDASEGHSAHDVEATARPAHVTGEQGDGNAPNATPAESVVISASNSRRMSMTPLEPREAGGLKGFGFTVRFDEPQAAMPAQTGGIISAPSTVAGPVAVESPASNPEAADLATVPVAETAIVPRVAAASEPIADISKPNPICRDPKDCGVYASWHLTCEACKRAAAHRVAA